MKKKCFAIEKKSSLFSYVLFQKQTETDHRSGIIVLSDNGICSGYVAKF